MMNARIPWKCTGKQRKAMMSEIVKQEKEMLETSEKNIDVAILWMLHEQLGFGAKRLRRFFDTFNRIYEELVAHYDMVDDLPWIYERKLKEIGVDVAEWRKETNDKSKTRKVPHLHARSNEYCACSRRAEIGQK